MKLFKVYRLYKETDQVEIVYRTANQAAEIYENTAYYEILKTEELPKVKYNSDGLFSALTGLGYKPEFSYLLVGLLEQYNDGITDEKVDKPFNNWKW